MDKNRKTAFLVLRDVESRDSYSNLALNQYIKAERPDTPAFVRELVYGVLERKLTLDYILNRLLVRPGSRVKAVDRVLIRMGLYQIIYMDSVPDYAAVDGCVRLARVFCRGREGFVNGVLRSYLKRSGECGKESLFPAQGELPEAEYLSVLYSYSRSIVELWLSQYGRELTERLLEAGNQKARLVIRANGLKIQPRELENRIAEQGFSARYLMDKECWPEDIFAQFEIEDPAAGEAGILPALLAEGSGILESSLYAEGYFSVQDQSSMLAVAALGPKPGETVVDVCAAPGGKTLFAAELMKNRGLISARDVYRSRLTLLQADAERLGIDIIRTKEFDGEQTDREFFEKADRVLVDAPCSGLGVVSRKPEIKYKAGEVCSGALPDKQLSILRASASYVKPGGTLVYSTCTVNRKENEEVASRFLEENRVFTLTAQRQIFPFESGADGFYICKMKKDG